MRPVGTAFLLLRRHEKRKFVALVIARVFVQALDLIGLAIVGILAAALATGLSNEAQPRILGIQVDFISSDSLIPLVVSMAGFFLAKSALSTGLLRATTSFLAQVEAQSAGEIANYLFGGDLTRLQEYSRSEHLWVASQSSQVAFSVMLFAGSALVTESALFLIIFSGFLLVDFQTAIAVVGYFLLVVGLFQAVIHWPTKRLGEALAENQILVNQSVLNLSATFREASVMERREFFLNRFFMARKQHARNYANYRFVLGLPRFFVEAALISGVALLVVWRSMSGSLEENLIVIAVFLTGGLRMMAALLPLQNSIADLRTMGPQARRAQEIIRSARRVKLQEQAEFFSGNRQDRVNNEHALQPGVEPGVTVRIEEVDFQFPGDELPTLKNISAELGPKSLTAIVGPSGAGKTTLANLVLGLLQPDSGSISINHQAPIDFRQAFPNAVSYVPQSPGIISGTLAENVALGIEANEIDKNRVREALEIAGLAEFLNGLRSGLETVVGKHGDSLSGGQLQRLGIARAVYQRPQLLVLDEATSALDAETESLISSTVSRLTASTTVLVIAHRLSTIQHADKVIVVENGSITAQGTFSQVRKRIPLIERYVDLLTIDPPTAG